MTLRLSQFGYDLPKELIAQSPAAAREDARLLVVDRGHDRRTHAAVSRLGEFFLPGDLLVVNDTKVLPARVRAKTVHGGRVEILFIRALESRPRATWLCLGRPAKRFLIGNTFEVGAGYFVQVVEQRSSGQCLIEMKGDASVLEMLTRCGELPLPPYIRRPEGPSTQDHERYQTIFANEAGSVAAPTAGLHFTHELIASLKRRGVLVHSLTLHVGPGTFLPVRAENVAEHEMQQEAARVPVSTCEAIAAAKRQGGRIVAVGTTTVRALESAARQGALDGRWFWADQYIFPPYRFEVVDSLFTNFHLPGSTLLMLVAAFLGRERMLEVYAEAVRLRYRFYSYGDAMLIQ